MTTPVAFLLLCWDFFAALLVSYLGRMLELSADQSGTLKPAAELLL